MRPTWDEYFMSLAREAASMSTCPRLSVGAVIVRDKQVISTGYNGAARGLPHCLDDGCLIVDGHCVRTVHAEANSLLFAGVERTQEATMYVTHLPCYHCAGLIINAGIKQVVYGTAYGSSAGHGLLKTTGINVRKLHVGNDLMRE